MIFLAGSIILTGYLILSFKALERWNINTFHAIVFNYITCVITGILINTGFPVPALSLSNGWLIWAVVMGSTFILLFNMIAFTAQKVGVAVASVANKLSMVIPFAFAMYYYHEPSTVLKATGIFLALLAVFFTCYRKRDRTWEVGTAWKLLYFVLPFVLFLGSGLLDTMIKYVEHAFINDSNRNEFLILAFGSAAAIGLSIYIVQIMGGFHRFSWKPVLAGLAIGIPNYFSIWCLLRALKSFSAGSSVIIPVNNMGIVLLNAIAAAILFREKLSLINWTGIILSLLAISLIAFG